MDVLVLVVERPLDARVGYGDAEVRGVDDRYAPVELAATQRTAQGAAPVGPPFVVTKGGGKNGNAKRGRQSAGGSGGKPQKGRQSSGGGDSKKDKHENMKANSANVGQPRAAAVRSRSPLTINKRSTSAQLPDRSRSLPWLLALPRSDSPGLIRPSVIGGEEPVDPFAECRGR